MADLGNLFFTLGLKDNTDEEYQKIKKKLEAKFNINPTINFRQAAENALKSLDKRGIRIKGQLDEEDLLAQIKKIQSRVPSIRLGVSASPVSGGNATAGNVRDERIQSIIQKRNDDHLLMMKRKEAQTLKNTAAQSRFNNSLSGTSGKLRGINRELISGGKLANEFRNQISGAFSLYSAERFLTSLYEIGGEFEKQHIALRSIIGDATKANVLFGQIKTLAVESPYSFQDLTAYTKQLSAFSIPYEEMYETTKRLADISAGLGVDMGRIILAYGQVRSAAFLRGQEVRQFTEAGIPLLDELAKKFTQLEGTVVSVGEVFDKISNREVPFQMVKDVLWDLTDEGGKFYNMQEELTKSLSGQLMKLKDSYQIMLYEISQGNHGALSGAVKLSTALMDNWRTMGTILTSLVVIYGSYKAAVMISNLLTAQSIIAKYGLAAASNIVTRALNREAAAHARLNIQTGSYIIALNKLKTALSSIGKAGVIGIIVGALATIGIVIFQAYQNATKLRREFDKISDASKNNFDNDVSGYSLLVKELERIKNKYGEVAYKTTEYQAVVDKIQQRYGEYIGNIDKEADAYDYLKGKINDVTEALRNKAIEDARQQGIAKIQEEYADLTDKMKDFTSSLVNNFGLTRSEAIKLSSILKNEFDNENNVDPYLSLYNSHDKFLEYIRAKANEIDITIKADYTDKGGEARRALRSVAKDIQSINGATGILNESINSTFGNYTLWGIQIDNLQKKFEESVKSITSEEEKQKKYLEFLESKADILHGAKQFGEEQKVKTQIESIKALSTEWVKEIKKIVAAQEDLGKGVAGQLIPTEEDIKKPAAYLDKLAEKYKETEKEIARLNSVPALLQSESVKNNIKSLESLLVVIKAVGEYFQTDFSRWGETNKKDTIAEKYKQQIDLLKKAMSLYEKYAGEVGKARAKEIVNEDEMFVGLDFDPDKYKDRVQQLINELKRLPKTDDREKLINQLIGTKSDIDYKDFKEGIDAAMETAKKYISEVTEKWNLYKKLFSSTQDRTLSMNLAFGGEVSYDSVLDDLAGSLREKAKEITSSLFKDSNPDLLARPLIDAAKLVEKGWEDAAEGIAAVFSVQYSVKDVKGDVQEILVTPILPNGDILSPEELDKYVQTALEGSENMLKADDKKLLIKVGVDEGEGDILHQLQQIIYGSEDDLMSLDVDTIKKQFGPVVAEFLEAYQQQSKKMRASQMENLLRMIDDYKDYATKIKDEATKLAEDISTINASNLPEDKKESLTKERNRQYTQKVASIEFEEFKDSDDWAKVFEDLDKLSTYTIDRILKKLQEFKEGAGKNLPIDEFKTLSNTIKNFEEESASRHPFKNMIESLSEIGELRQKVKEANQIVQDVKSGKEVKDAEGNVIDLEKAERDLADAQDELSSTSDKVKKAIKEITEYADMAVSVINDLASAFSSMGNEGMSDFLSSSAEVISNISSIAAGAATAAVGIMSTNPLMIAQGAVSAISGITGLIGSIAKIHDKKLDKVIQRSQLEVKKLENSYKNLSDTIERQLGNQTKEQTDEMLQNLQKQRSELEKQLRAEEDKKKSDPAKIEDYKQQIKELGVEIDYFYENLANELYSIDIKGWAEEFSSALVEAWRNGEDAAEAFQKTASDVLANVASNMLRMAIIEPLFEKMKEEIPRMMEDGVLDNSELGEIAGMLLDIEKGYQQGVDYLDKLDKIIQEKTNGELSLKNLNQESSSGLSKGIQSVTEDTASLIASYINSIRQDGAAKRMLVQRIIEEFFPAVDVLMQAQLQQLNQISQNTLRNAEAADRIYEILNGARLSKDRGLHIL